MRWGIYFGFTPESNLVCDVGKLHLPHPTPRSGTRIMNGILIALKRMPAPRLWPSGSRSSAVAMHSTIAGICRPPLRSPACPDAAWPSGLPIYGGLFFLYRPEAVILDVTSPSTAPDIRIMDLRSLFRVRASIPYHSNTRLSWREAFCPACRKLT